MSRLETWVQASRPPLQGGFALPLIYGQALSYRVHGTFSLRFALFAMLYGVLAQLFIVFSNDIADVEVDSHNTTFSAFSGGSRVVPEGKLGFMDLAGGAALALFALAALSVYLVFREHRLWMLVLVAITAHLTWMYSFPPFRLSYRGLGELPHAVGMGILLPVVGFYVQTGTLHGLSPFALVPSFIVGFAANVTTALPDAPADRIVNKRTYSVRRGEYQARRASLVLLGIAALATPLAVPGAGALTSIAVVLATGLVLSRNLPLLASADAERRDLCRRFTANNVATILVVYVAWSLAAVLLRVA